MVKKIDCCRICGGKKLTTVVSLGEQVLTGVFPRTKSEKITKGPLDLVWCHECTLLQLGHSYQLDEMYGENYGYRSGLNKSMVMHLQNKIHQLEVLVQPNDDDIVLDIGSNDATSLKAYGGKYRRIGIDPTAKKFKQYYTDDIQLVPDFFSAANFSKVFPGEKASIITSIAMFYDLESPADFVRDIAAVLSENGVWHFEQSYMPSMLRTNAYDTICHEHLEFYSLKVVKELLNRFDLRIVDVQMNSINGGSFSVTACKNNARYKSNKPVIDWLLNQEDELKLNTIEPYLEFAEKILQHKNALKSLIDALVSDGKTVLGYGASTKGNVMLQLCELSSEQIGFIAEVNEDKFGSFTPGSLIPIISEEEAKAKPPDYFLVLPWHFKETILAREKSYLAKGGKLIFPLPEIEII